MVLDVLAVAHWVLLDVLAVACSVCEPRVLARLLCCHAMPAC